MRKTEHLKRLTSQYAGKGVILFVIGCALGVDSGQTAFAADDSSLFNYPKTALEGAVGATIAKPVADCQRICSTRLGCAGFDYSEKAGSCRLYTSVRKANADVDSTAGTRAIVDDYPDPTNLPLSVRFERLKQSDHEGSQLLALSEEAYNANARDIGWQAINLAVDLGNQDAKLQMGQWYDPRSFAPNRVNAANADMAARAYFELSNEKGNSKATALLTSLCDESKQSSSNFSSSFAGFHDDFFCPRN